MTREELAEAIELALTRTTCPEIQTVVYTGSATLGVETRDGDRFFLEVQHV